MPTSGSRNDPLASFNFIVTVESMRAGFAEVGGLATETDIIEYREGAEDITVRKIPGKRKYTNISLKRGYTPDGKDLWAWRKTVMDGKDARNDPIDISKKAQVFSSENFHRRIMDIVNRESDLGQIRETVGTST